MGSLGYDEGCNPKTMKSQEREYRSHGRIGVDVVATRLQLNIEFTRGNLGNVC